MATWPRTRPKCQAYNVKAEANITRPKRGLRPKFWPVCLQGLNVNPHKPMSEMFSSHADAQCA